jgi:hypothetical protein
MSMFGEIATEGTIKGIVGEIKAMLEHEKNPEARAALKKIGRFSLRQFDWSTPEWAAEYEELFKENG